MSITLSSNRASFEAFEARVESAALNRYLAQFEDEPEDDPEYDDLLAYEDSLVQESIERQAVAA